jgi:primary-amine oxidase
MAPHPLADLTAAEIVQARSLIQGLHPRTTLSFKAITLEEPEKNSMVKYLEAEHAGVRLSPPPRIAYCAYYIRGTVRQC